VTVLLSRHLVENLNHVVLLSEFEDRCRESAIGCQGAPAQGLFEGARAI
jgi:hypothetical protein